MKKPRLLACLGLLLLSACAQSGLQIGTRLEVCCPGTYSDYQEYRLEVVDMPLFLRRYVVNEFEQAFQEKGIQRNDQFNDLRVVLSYNHINLNPEQEDIDPLIRMESITTELNYIAEIEIDMYETRSGNLVWSGSISRIHHVTPGEYMHEDRARGAFRQAFRTVLASYPPLESDES